ncbi:PIN domain-containing protein [Halobacterium salinarum]|uniref:type II toxin-antitoxin system VapC family toxin n=1 Tax=Halobacterium salinarum TaxID=2242 RepID=UPI0025571D76|nr:PIN domain-containing protein [Halobacterium salinarum]MDL0118534.1 PIN domain-containing protein [Halobacterium salinarum]MDL0119156.1 PIN domain-containing protein [Halobacterium salinarum]MDL0119805.1 PIN domain-containing protein [Halobacterium salinarum]MDL0135374.1 PIN domain-containing protein [Halobacterium salinarum]MDL0138542.1 PIN domain-containing protein [Halobacterium salinarum]
MAVAVVDTGVLIGMADSDDEHHGVAKEIVQGMDHGDLPTGRVTNYIILETLNWIHTRKRHEKAVETRRRLNKSAGFEVLQAAQKDFHRAVELFETYDGFAFGDATIAAYMEREDIEYLYSFDDDFDAIEDITRLETPDNPHNSR